MNTDQIYTKRILYNTNQGRLIRYLHEKWHSFSFDPLSDNIETFIRDVKATANQLGHRNESIPNLIKACMPTEIYGTLYSITDSADLIKMVKDIYAMKPDTSKTTAMTSTTLAPCSKNCNTTFI